MRRSGLARQGGGRRHSGAMSTDDNDAYGNLDKSNLKFIYEQFLEYILWVYIRQGRKDFLPALYFNSIY